MRLPYAFLFDVQTLNYSLPMIPTQLGSKKIPNIYIYTPRIHGIDPWDLW